VAYADRHLSPSEASPAGSSGALRALLRFGSQEQPAPAEPAVVSAPRRCSADVRLPCMVYAAVGALPEDADAPTLDIIEEMRKAPGVVQVLSYGKSCGRGVQVAQPAVAVVARGYWLTRQVLARLMAQLPDDDQARFFQANVDAALAGASLARGTAQMVEGRLRLWVATVDEARTRAAAARIAGLEEDHVDLRVIGAIDTDDTLRVLVPAIELARQLQPTPVQVIAGPDLDGHWSPPASVSVATEPAPLRFPAPESTNVLGASNLAAA